MSDSDSGGRHSDSAEPENTRHKSYRRSRSPQRRPERRSGRDSAKSHPRSRERDTRADDEELRQRRRERERRHARRREEEEQRRNERRRDDDRRERREDRRERQRSYDRSPNFKRKASRSASPPPQQSTEDTKENIDYLASKRKKVDDNLTTKTGGAYIPPARLRMMQEQITDKAGAQYQRLSWEALKKSINGLINKVNVSNIVPVVQELFQENIVRGRGLLSRSVLQAQAASPTFTHVYAALVAIINTKFPQIGELILKRLIINFRNAFRRNNKDICLSSTRFIAHLVNQQVAHEIVSLEILTLLLETATDDSVEVAVGFLKECGQKLTEVSPRGINAIFDRLRTVLHEGEIDKRVQYMVEVMYAVRKDGFKDHPVMLEELDLVEEDDQFTHMMTLEEATDPENLLNVFKIDPDFEATEEKYKVLKKEILDEGSSDEEGGSGSGSGSGESSSSDEEDEEEKQKILDATETNLVTLRKTIYLTIQSSLDFEECVHKLLKMELKPGQEAELCNMILDCCAQQRTYEKFYGLMAQRFCMLDKKYIEPFQTIFAEQYETIHRLETNKLRNVSKFFAHLLFTDAISWEVMSHIKLNEDDTTSSSRIFIKILFQELSEYMGLPKLNDRLKDGTLQVYFEGVLPRDHPKNTRFAINFFTSIGLGGLTDDLRDHLKNAPKPTPQVATVTNENDSSNDSSSDSSSSSSNSGSESDTESSSSEEEEKSLSRKKRREKESLRKKNEKRQQIEMQKEVEYVRKRRKAQPYVSNTDDDDEPRRRRDEKNREKVRNDRKANESRQDARERGRKSRRDPSVSAEEIEIIKDKKKEKRSYEKKQRDEARNGDIYFEEREMRQRSRHDRERDRRENSRDGRELRRKREEEDRRDNRKLREETRENRQTERHERERNSREEMDDRRQETRDRYEQRRREPSPENRRHANREQVSRHKPKRRHDSASSNDSDQQKSSRDDDRYSDNRYKKSKGRRRDSSSSEENEEVAYTRQSHRADRETRVVRSSRHLKDKRLKEEVIPSSPSESPSSSDEDERRRVVRSAIITTTAVSNSVNSKQREYKTEERYDSNSSDQDDRTNNFNDAHRDLKKPRDTVTSSSEASSEEGSSSSSSSSSEEDDDDRPERRQQHYSRSEDSKVSRYDRHVDKHYDRDSEKNYSRSNRGHEQSRGHGDHRKGERQRDRERRR